MMARNNKMDKFERFYVNHSKEEIDTIRSANRMHMLAHFISRIMFLLAAVPAIVIISLAPMTPFMYAVYVFAASAIALWLTARGARKRRDDLLAEKSMMIMMYDPHHDMIIVGRV